MTWVMPPVRKKFDLFTALRPALSHPNIPSVHKNVDIAFFRELTEGMLYSETVVAGLPEFRPNDDITISSRVITRKGSNRVAREAFELARTRPRKKVTAAHKEPVYRLACGMSLRTMNWNLPRSPVSTALRSTSPWPCAPCASPVENSAPAS